VGQSELGAAASRKAVWWDLCLASLLTHLLFFSGRKHISQKNQHRPSTDDTRRDACMYDVSCEIIAMLLFFVDFYCFCVFVTFPNKIQ